MPDPMKAAVYAGNRTVAVQDMPVPVPSAGEVVIAVDYCGICGTDLHSVMEGWGRAGGILLHEYSGRIASGFEDALRLLASGALPLNALIAPGAVPLASIMSAMEDLAAGQTAAKVLVAPGA